MNRAERRITATLALMLLCRMLGLFMVLPVLSPWALELAGQPGLAVGLAVGVYGLTQALLQIPLGWLSDHVGRKPVILGGLLCFVAGSAICAQAETVQGLVLGRLAQGGGAIAATSTALLADLLRAQVRSTAMAIVGISVAGAFALSLLIGPALIGWTGVPGLFWLATVMGFVAISLLATLPAAPATVVDAQDAPSKPQGANALILGIGSLHAALAFLFVVLPLEIDAAAGGQTQMQWRIWLPTVVLSLVVVFPLLRVVEKRGWEWRSMPWAFAIMAMATGALGVIPDWGLVAVLSAYFAAFNFLEASLPALLSRLVGQGRRGRIMGQFSAAQFLGIFVGGAIAGAVHAQAGAAISMLVSALLLIPAWVAVWLPARRAWRSELLGQAG